MRVLTVHPGPHFSVADVYRGWLKAFRQLGVQVADFNLGDRLGFYSTAGRMTDNGEFVRMVDDAGAARMAAKGLEAACYTYQPDVLFVVSCFYLPPDTLDIIRRRGTAVVILHTEEPYEHDRSIARGVHADLNLVNDPIHLAQWRQLGPAEYVPHAYDPDLHNLGPAKPHAVSDFCFVGTGYPGRVRFLEQVDWSGIDVALAGHWQCCELESPLRKFLAHDVNMCCDNTETVDLYHGAKVGANIYRREAERPDLAEGWACGPREIEMAACGLPFVREARGESDTLFGTHPVFTTPAEFGEQVRYLLAHDDQRDLMAAHARRSVADRTFEANAKRFLTLASGL